MGYFDFQEDMRMGVYFKSIDRTRKPRHRIMTAARRRELMAEADAEIRANDAKAAELNERSWARVR